MGVGFTLNTLLRSTSTPPSWN